MNRDYISSALFVSQKKAQEIFDELTTIINLVVGAANSIAGKAMFDAIDKVKLTQYYKQPEIRRHLKWAESLYYKYEKAHLRNFGENKTLFLDYLDNAEADIQEYVDLFRQSIKTAFDKYMQPESELKSYLETANNLLGFACHLYDVQIKTAREKAPLVDFDKYMRPARLTGVLKRYEEAAEVICNPKGLVIDLNEDADCLKTFKAIEAKITDEDFLNHVGYKALKLNPENVAKVTPEDMKILEDRYKDK